MYQKILVMSPALKLRHRSEVINFILKKLPEVFSVVKVPGRSMAHHVPPVRGFLVHSVFPKLLWYFDQSHVSKEVVCYLKHLHYVPTLNAI